MAKRRHTPERAINKLREAEVAIAELWRRDAGRRRAWSRSIRGRRRQDAPPSGWRRRKYHDSH